MQFVRVSGNRRRRSQFYNPHGIYVCSVCKINIKNLSQLNLTPAVWKRGKESFTSDTSYTRHESTIHIYIYSSFMSDVAPNFQWLLMDVIRPADRDGSSGFANRNWKAASEEEKGGRREDREQNIGKFFIANAISRVLHVPATEGLSILSKLKISIRAKGDVVLPERGQRVVLSHLLKELSTYYLTRIKETFVQWIVNENWIQI